MCKIGWNDLGLFALIKNGHYAADQVYFYPIPTNRHVRGATFLLSKNCRDLTIKYFSEQLQKPSFYFKEQMPNKLGIQFSLIYYYGKTLTMDEKKLCLFKPCRQNFQIVCASKVGNFKKVIFWNLAQFFSLESHSTLVHNVHTNSNYNKISVKIKDGTEITDPLWCEYIMMLRERIRRG